jgi:hypothetical protein
MLLTSIPLASQPQPYQEFHRALGRLADQTGGPWTLGEVSGQWNWPERGIYIFLNADSHRVAETVSQAYVTRIGTVGDCAGSSSTLWSRLRAHRGNTRGDYAGGGNHRGSVFRRHVGEALIEAEGLHDQYPHWGKTHAQLPDGMETTALRQQEHSLEQQVSQRIRSLPFLVVDVPGEPGPQSSRATLERNLIALVAQLRLRDPSLKRGCELQQQSPTPAIARSELWNVNHVNELFQSDTPRQFAEYVEQTASPVPGDN